MVIVKYTWRELTLIGNLKPIKIIETGKFFIDNYNTEKEAIEAFDKQFGSEYNYPNCVLIKVYGSET